MTRDNARQFELALQIDASPDVIWQAISNDVELTRWFAPQASVTPGVGGTVNWNWAGHHDWPQTIEVWEPGSRLKTRYDSPVDDGRGGKLPLFIDFQLQGEHGATTLRLVHSGFGPEADFDAEFDGISHGWPVELRSLKLYVEKHFGQERRLAWSSLGYEGAADEVWNKLTGPQGLNCGPEIDKAALGTRFGFTTAEGDRLAGTTLPCQPREFTGIANSHDDGFLRICVYDLPGMKQIWLWLATYGDEPSAIQEIQQHWDAMLARLFPQFAHSESISS